MVANGNGHVRNLKAGVWAPIPTFFDDNEEIGELRVLATGGLDASLTGHRLPDLQRPCGDPRQGRHAARCLRLDG